MEAHSKMLVLSQFSRVRLFATLGTVAHQAPLSMGFSRQEYSSELPCTSAGIKCVSLTSPALAGRLFTTSITLGACPNQDPGKILAGYLFICSFFFNWHMVDLQHCVSFRCRAKSISYTYISIYSFSDSFLL